MSQVTELGYLGIGVKDLDAWKQFAGEVIGLQVIDGDERNSCYLRMDYWHHRIAVRQDGSDDLTYLGLRVAGPEEFHQMRAQLSEAGVKYRAGSPEEAAERRVLELLKLEDPGGNPIEIFHGPQVDYHSPFWPGRGMHGRFKTGEEGLGHCLLREDDHDKASRFYALLGMRGGIEYKLSMPNGGLAQPRFFHCNNRDHTIAFGLGKMAKRINHMELEVDNLNDVGLTYDLARKYRLPIAIQPGKHANDHMFSFYVANPSGWLWEYGYGGRSATYQSEYYIRDIWGHDQGDVGFGMDGVEMKK
jgi:2,3-dihydroxybiphenyl 1,2-dioxygenase